MKNKPTDKSVSLLLGEQKYLSSSESETSKIAQALTKKIVPGDVVAFYGDLGTGKTFFIKSFCRRLGVINEVTSPTFAIIKEYYTKKELFIYHFDFYRIENDHELLNLGLDDFFYSQNICLIEWADKITKYLPKNRWEVRLNFLSNKPNCRDIRIVKIDKSI